MLDRGSRASIMSVCDDLEVTTKNVVDGIVFCPFTQD